MPYEASTDALRLSPIRIAHFLSDSEKLDQHSELHTYPHALSTESGDNHAVAEDDGGGANLDHGATDVAKRGFFLSPVSIHTRLRVTPHQSGLILRTLP